MAEPTAPMRDQHRGGVALLIIDMINCFDFDGADELQQKAIAAADAIRRLRDQVEAAGGDTIYVNDNFGEWHSEKSKLVERAHAQGSQTAALLAPREQDYFIIKPHFSGFYASNLPVLLPKLGADRLIITGIATDMCVLFTAADAHMRDYALWIPADAVAAAREDRHRWALEIMASGMGARVDATRDLAVERWVAEHGAA